MVVVREVIGSRYHYPLPHRGGLHKAPLETILKALGSTRTKAGELYENRHDVPLNRNSFARPSCTDVLPAAPAAYDGKAGTAGRLTEASSSAFPSYRLRAFCARFVCSGV